MYSLEKKNKKIMWKKTIFVESGRAKKQEAISSVRNADFMYFPISEYLWLFCSQGEE